MKARRTQSHLGQKDKNTFSGTGEITRILKRNILTVIGTSQRETVCTFPRDLFPEKIQVGQIFHIRASHTPLSTSLSIRVRPLRKVTAKMIKAMKKKIDKDFEGLED